MSVAYIEGVFKRAKSICINGCKVANQTHVVDITGRQNLTHYENFQQVLLNTEPNTLKDNEFLVTRDNQVFHHLLGMLGMSVACGFKANDHLCAS